MFLFQVCAYFLKTKNLFKDNSPHNEHCISGIYKMSVNIGLREFKQCVR